ncbi:hypothetical protein LX32DRAFT_244810 [Colletotrichum zoysiae]|uniref:Uncharacterized protein n=1 Tax=Colletotrichum zoysiae TaxID=1216348 RepID=A0AAD9HMW0_9PEZI|nr:hypothetical protein LX32DRAFT_244810 [Colletotrichum zoysiae]
MVSLLAWSPRRADQEALLLLCTRQASPQAKADSRAAVGHSHVRGRCRHIISEPRRLRPLRAGSRRAINHPSAVPPNSSRPQQRRRDRQGYPRDAWRLTWSFFSSWARQDKGSSCGLVANRGGDSPSLWPPRATHDDFKTGGMGRKKVSGATSSTES